MSGPTSPDEFQKQMQDFLQKQFKTFGTPGFAGAEPTGTVTQPEPEPAPERFRFRLQAARRQDAPRPLRHQAGGGQKSAERGVVRPLQRRAPSVRR